MFVYNRFEVMFLHEVMVHRSVIMFLLCLAELNFRNLEASLNSENVVDNPRQVAHLCRTTTTICL